MAGVLVLIGIFFMLDPFLFPFPKCPFRMVTGLQCPGCGAQRAFYHVIHGNITESFRMNMLFLPAVMYGMLAFLMSTVFPGRWQGIRARFFGLHAAWITLAVIISFWILRNI